jgi:hypothetical protein
MHGPIFENRLHHDAAEIFRVAERIEAVAERNGNVRQMEGDAKLLSIIVERMERTLTEAATFAIRNPHHRGSGCRTHVVQGHLAALCQQVAHLRRDLETLCQASARPRYETRYETRYRPSLDWEAERYEAERNEARGWPTNRPYGFEQEIYQPRSWSPTYEYPQTRTQVIPNGPAPGGITLGNGRFSIQFGR